MTHRLLVSIAIFLTASPTFGEDRGWVDLFDGMSLEGWRRLDGKPVRGWTAESGVLRYTPPKEGGGNDLYTEKEYANFILELEWKIAPRGNSGVKYRMSWYGKSYLGPEYQMLDNTRMSKDSRLTKGNATGALYDLLPVDAASWSVKPIGEWNSTRIVADGSHVEHWLNGKKIVDVDLRSERFKKAVAESKFRNRRDFAQNASGRIMLQDHGCEMQFRKIRLKELRSTALGKGRSERRRR